MSDTVEFFQQRHDESIRRMSLRGIEKKSQYLRDDATSLQDYVRRLSALPTHEEIDKNAVNEAETALTEALLAVKLVKAELERKEHGREHRILRRRP